ncbi:hypothetical protein BCR35DRAFT_340611 [Leucosporidium creatinivorum]|uniref:Uncharacterized protein n=1 Tax=Leucosporidium creatinivorum TaxID=106004 RepID=A0A1Y2G2X5_9BASI|nr:hypothetical protein BCR35DRAFT_340611 [Leucosporidium creatinivorum]
MRLFGHRRWVCFFSFSLASLLPALFNMPRQPLRKLSTDSDPTLPARSSRLGPQSEGSRRRAAQTKLESLVKVLDAVQTSPVTFPEAPFHSLLVPTLRRAAELSKAAHKLEMSDNSSSTKRHPILDDFVTAVSRFATLMDQELTLGRQARIDYLRRSYSQLSATVEELHAKTDDEEETLASLRDALKEDGDGLAHLDHVSSAVLVLASESQRENPIRHRDPRRIAYTIPHDPGARIGIGVADRSKPRRERIGSSIRASFRALQSSRGVQCTVITPRRLAKLGVAEEHGHLRTERLSLTRAPASSAPFNGRGNLRPKARSFKIPGPRPWSLRLLSSLINSRTPISKASRRGIAIFPVLRPGSLVGVESQETFWLLTMVIEELFCGCNGTDGILCIVSLFDSTSRPLALALHLGRRGRIALSLLRSACFRFYSPLHGRCTHPVSSRTAPQSIHFFAALLVLSFPCFPLSPSSSSLLLLATMDGLPGIFGQAASARRRPVLGRASTTPGFRRPSLLAGVSDADRRSRAMSKFTKLESLINRVKTSPRPFTPLGWAERIEPQLIAAQRAEQQARMVPATNEPRPERDAEEIEAFVEATDRLKNSVDLDLIAGRPARLAWLELTLGTLKGELRNVNDSAASPRQRGEIMGFVDGVHTLAMEVLEMDHASAEELVSKVEIVAGLKARIEGLLYSVTHLVLISFTLVGELTLSKQLNHANDPPPRAAPLPPPRNPARLAAHPSASSSSAPDHASPRHGATFSLAHLHAHEPVLGGRQAKMHGMSLARLQARYGY